MKRIIPIIVAMLVLAISVSGVLAQTVTTLQMGDRTSNIYKIQNPDGTDARITEYYVLNDGSGYGNEDTIYDENDRQVFHSTMECKGTTCTISEERTTYLEDGTSTTDVRTTVMTPEGPQSIMTVRVIDTENQRTADGVILNGKGEKTADVHDSIYTSEYGEIIDKRIISNTDNSQEEYINVKYPDGSIIRSEATYDPAGRQTTSCYWMIDEDGGETQSENSSFTYEADGTVTKKTVVINNLNNEKLVFTETQKRNGSTAFGELMDLDSNKLADYSAEEEIKEDGSIVRVETYVDVNGKVDILSYTTYPNGEKSVKVMSNFQAGGDPNTAEDDEEFDPFYFFEWDDLTDVDALLSEIDLSYVEETSWVNDADVNRVTEEKDQNSNSDNSDDLDVKKDENMPAQTDDESDDEEDAQTNEIDDEESAEDDVRNESDENNSIADNVEPDEDDGRDVASGNNDVDDSAEPDEVQPAVEYTQPVQTNQNVSENHSSDNSDNGGSHDDSGSGNGGDDGWDDDDE